ncbi:MAG: HEAT repeat domain-containing protein [Calothrix sp. MO_192.B10]|nr:HEAT repeat domain-containing protein [Calothrix sp. MO_192.B10]
MGGVELARIMAPIAGVVAKPLSEKIQSKLNPNQLEKALNHAIKSSSQLGEDLFERCEPDGINGVGSFLEKFFKDVVIDEFQKFLDTSNTPNKDYLVLAFQGMAKENDNIKKINEKLVKPWINELIDTFVSGTYTYLKFPLAKDNYLNKLADRLSKLHFVGMRVAVSENNASERLEKIFVMPDVAESVSKSQLSKQLELDFYLSADISRRQAELLQAQQEKALLLQEQSETRNPFPAQNLLDQSKSKGNKIVLLGTPGSGKTTLMNYLALKIAQRKLADLGLAQNTINQKSIPIFIRIRELAQLKHLDILEYIQEYAAKNLQVTDLPNGCFKHWLEQGEVVILLDGLDEVAQENQQVKIVEHIASFLKEFHRNQVIITSRPAGYERGYFRVDDFPHYEIQAFDDPKIERFISQWYDSRCDDKREAARQKTNLQEAIERQDRIKLLARNPLLLTIIALINRVGAELPRERYKLYESAVETLLTAWDAGKGDGKDKELSYRLPLEYLKPRDFKPLMQEIAFWIHGKGSTGDKEGGTLINQDDLIKQLTHCILRRYKRKNIELYEAEGEAKSFLGYIRERAGLLDVQGKNCYAFVHKTFQEYLAAEDIDYRHRNDDSFKVVLDSIGEHLHDPHWREVLLLLVAKQEPKKAARAIRKILHSDSPYEKWLHRDLFFAADCLAEDPIDLQLADDDPSQEILEKLVELEVSNSPVVISKIHGQVFETICSLHETEFTDDVLRLLKKNESSINKVRFQRYRAALGQEQAAIEQLLQLLKDPNSDVRSGAAFALGEIKSEAAIPGSIKLLEHEDPDVRNTAALALREIKSDAAIPELIKLLEHEDPDVRRDTAYVLEKIKSEAAIPGLIQLLKDETSSVRITAASALGEIKSEVAIPGLIQLLEHEDSSVRITAASALGEIKSEVAIPGLIQLLEHEASDVRSGAAYALGEIKSEAAIPGLIQLLEDETSDVRSGAAYALGEIKSEAAIPGLIQLLKDETSDVRSGAAYALGEIKSEAAIPGLIQLLEDEDPDVRSDAAYALGEIKSEAAIPGLIQLLEYEDPDVRSGAADVLGEIEFLFLKDKVFDVRDSAASALGEIKSEAAIPGLIQLLEHEDPDVRDSAADVLISIKSEAAIPGLIQLLEHEDSSVRLYAAFALISIKSEAAIPELIQLLEDEDSFVRFRAASALGEIKSEAAIPGLIQLLEDEDSDVRYSVASALGEIKSEAAIPGLIQLLEDENSSVRDSAALALGNLGNASDKVVVALEKWLEEQEDSEYKKYGITALWNLVVGAS